MNKLIKIVFVNILLLLLLVICAEIYYRHAAYIQENKILNRQNDFSSYMKKLTSPLFVVKENYPVDNFQFRPAAAVKTNKKDILLLGCSYTYGDNLENEQAFHSILSKYTKRNVYNMGMSGASIREMLYILQNHEKFSEFLPEDIKPEYVIYTYISDHIARLFLDFHIESPRYKIDLKNKKLTPVKNHINTKMELYLKNQGQLFYKFKQDKYVSDVIELYFNELKKEIYKLYGENTKIIILVYENSNHSYLFPYDELKKDGFEIIDVNELTGKNMQDAQYRQKDDDHPNEKAWEIIVPKLAEQLK